MLAYSVALPSFVPAPVPAHAPAASRVGEVRMESVGDLKSLADKLSTPWQPADSPRLPRPGPAREPMLWRIAARCRAPRLRRGPFDVTCWRQIRLSASGTPSGSLRPSFGTTTTRRPLDGSAMLRSSMAALRWRPSSATWCRRTGSNSRGSPSPPSPRCRRPTSGTSCRRRPSGRSSSASASSSGGVSCGWSRARSTT